MRTQLYNANEMFRTVLLSSHSKQSICLFKIDVYTNVFLIWGKMNSVYTYDRELLSRAGNELKQKFKQHKNVGDSFQ